jgi:hypothetical protein
MPPTGTPLPPTDTSLASYVPSTPDPQMVTLVAALIRHLLTIASGAGIAVGAYSDSSVAIAASGIVGAAAIGWSIIQKIRSARTEHASAVRSAQIAQPVKATLK